jgi:hypothetical protein
MEEKVSKKYLYFCSMYKNRPDACVGYPWNDANDIFPECQFYDKENKKLLTIEETLKFKTQAEIERFCVECGRCCMNWYNGKVVSLCSALRIVDNADFDKDSGSKKFSLPVL